MVLVSEGNKGKEKSKEKTNQSRKVYKEAISPNASIMPVTKEAAR